MKCVNTTKLSAPLLMGDYVNASAWKPSSVKTDAGQAFSRRPKLRIGDAGRGRPVPASGFGVANLSLSLFPSLSLPPFLFDAGTHPTAAAAASASSSIEFSRFASSGGNNLGCTSTINNLLSRCIGLDYASEQMDSHHDVWLAVMTLSNCRLKRPFRQCTYVPEQFGEGGKIGQYE